MTGYDPSAAAGQNVVGGYTLMDRNIGALNKTPGDRDSFGLAYQWGRKDPFPGSDGSRQGTWIELSDYREIWNGEGYQKLRAFMLSPEGAKGCPGCYERKVSPCKSAFKPVEGVEGAEQSEAWKNYELMVREIDEGKTELSCKPGAVMYYPSLACDFRCVMCAQAELRDQNIHLPERMDKEVMDLLPYMVMFHIIGGEPFIQPAWRRLLEEYTPELNPCLKFEAITNGALVNRSLLDKLSVFPAVWITFSFDGSTKELFDSIRVSKAGFEVVFANLLACIKHQREVGEARFKVNASMTVQKSNIHDMVNMLRLIREENADITFSPLMMQPIPLSLRHYNDAPTEIDWAD